MPLLTSFGTGPFGPTGAPLDQMIAGLLGPPGPQTQGGPSTSFPGSLSGGAGRGGAGGPFGPAHPVISQCDWLMRRGKWESTRNGRQHLAFTSKYCDKKKQKQIYSGFSWCGLLFTTRITSSHSQTLMAEYSAAPPAPRESTTFSPCDGVNRGK